MSDSELLKECTVSAYKGSGNGGQHRNKTNSGVKIELRIKFPSFRGVAAKQTGCAPKAKDTRIEVYSCDDRSAHINKLYALKKLRLKIALQIREEPAEKIPFPFPGSNGKISPDNKLYPQFIADVLDRDFDSAAEMWGLSKSALNKIISADKKVLEVYNKYAGTTGISH